MLSPDLLGPIIITPNKDTYSLLAPTNLGGGPGVVVKATCLESRRSQIRLRSQVSKIQNVSSPLTRKDSILWAPV